MTCSILRRAMAALPSKAEAQKLLLNDNLTAYHLYDTILLPAEKAASEATDDGATFRTMLARVVGYLLLYPPSNQARAVVHSEVERCRDERNPNEAIYDLGEMYVMDFILPFYSIPEETTPQVSGVDSRDFYAKSIKERARQSRLNLPRDTAEAKDFARVRDGFRCMVSHVGDYFAMQGGIIDEAKEREAREPGRSWWTISDCRHIIPEALETVREDYWPINIAMPRAEAFWAILERFGYGNVHDELKGTKIHRLDNVMTLAGSLHALFRSLDIWFEKVQEDDQGNWYGVGGSPSRSLYEQFEVAVPETIRFVAHANFPLPNPTYLHIHAACCRIARLSGAWSHLERLFWEEVRKMEDRRLTTGATRLGHPPMNT